MYLRPGKHFNRVDGYDISGLVGRMRADGLEIKDCMYDSPAEEAGLERGDLVLAIDGHPVNLKNQSWFLQRIQQRGTTLRIRFRRRDVEQVADLKLPSGWTQELDITRLALPERERRPQELPEFDEDDDDQSSNLLRAVDGRCTPDNGKRGGK